MGVVVAAMHVELGQRVAIKFLNPAVLDNPDAVARFTREARAAVRIRSEHVARVTDVGRLDNGAPYMVMEYLEGEDLAAAVARGPLLREDAVDYLIQACDAMAEAHVEGIVHRDLKPANLFLVARTDGSASVKVLDFGISKLMLPETGDASLTRTATLMGSPLYMSPEQLKSPRDVDPRADVWSLGVILFELLVGRPPFNAPTLAELVAVILHEPTPRLTALLPDVPVALERAVLRCLEKEREQRFQNVGELAAALVNFGSQRSRVTAERVVRIVSRSPSLIPAAPSPSDPPVQPLKIETGVPTAPGDTGTAAGWVGGTGLERRRREITLVVAGLVFAGLLYFGVTRRGARAPDAEPVASVPAARSVAPEMVVAPVAGSVKSAETAEPPASASSSSPVPAKSALALHTEASLVSPAKGTTSKPRALRENASGAAPETGKKTLTIELK
jgi:serine/threonine-protein kinase